MRKMKSNKILKTLLMIVIISALLIPSLVLATNSLMVFNVAESSGINYPMLPIMSAVDNTILVSQGKISAAGLNTQVTINGTSVPRLVADDKTLFCYPILANSNNNFLYNTKTTPDTSMPIIVGQGGYITTADDSSLELGSNGIIEISGYFDTTAGVGKNILNKSSALVWNIDASTSGKMSVTAYGSGTTTIDATGITSGTHRFKVTLDGANLILDEYVGGAWVNKATDAFADSITDNGNDWIWNQGNVMPYADYINIYSATSDGRGIIDSQYGDGSITLSDTKGVFIYTNVSDNEYYYAVWEYNPATGAVTFGAPQQDPTFHNYDDIDFDIDFCILDSSTFVVYYEYTFGGSSQFHNFYTTVCTVSGTVITFGTAYDDLGADTFTGQQLSDMRIVGMDSTHAVWVRATDSTNCAIVAGELFGGDMVTGTPVDLATNILYLQLVKLDSTKGVLIYQGNTGQKIYGRVFTLSGVDGTDITLGSAVDIISVTAPNTVSNAFASALSSSKMVLNYTWWDGSAPDEYIKYAICSVSGNSITTGTSVTGSAYSNGLVLATSSTKFYSVTQDQYITDGFRLRYNSVSGTTITLGLETLIRQDGVGDALENTWFGGVSPSRTLTMGTNHVVFTPDYEDDGGTIQHSAIDIFDIGDYDVTGTSDLLLYQPNTIISGTTLPDRETGDGSQDGTITWGSNPAGIAAISKNVPSVTTNAATDKDLTSATLNGNLDTLGDYLACEVFFHYGPTSAMLLQTTPETKTTAPISFYKTIINLSPGRTYYFKATARLDSGNEIDGNTLTFDTMGAQKPTSPTNPTTSSVNLGKGQTYVTRLGPKLSGWFDSAGVVFGTDGKGFGGGLTFLILVIILLACSAKGYPIAGLAIGYPLQLGSAWCGLWDWIWVGVVTFILALVWVYKTWLEK